MRITKLMTRMKTVEWMFQIKETEDLFETCQEIEEAYPHWEIRPYVEKHMIYVKYQIPDDANPNIHSGGNSNG